MKMYKSNMLNLVIECVEDSGDKYMSEWEHYTSLQTLHLLIDKFNLDVFMNDYSFTEDEYKKYFKKFTKNHSMYIHKVVKEEFKKNKGDRDET